jgi:tripartite-type tricarboxylate transporter receptor subunit TctC
MQAAQTLVRAGRLRGIAVSNPKRIAAMAEVPAMAEVLPGFELVGWYGIAGPAKMPKPLVSRLNTELLKFLAMPDVRERILADGSEPVGNDPETFRKYMLADMIKWAKLVKESGAKL